VLQGFVSSTLQLESLNIICLSTLISSMVKVAVVGVGNLGSCIAFEVARRGLADELVLVDIRRELAEGNAGDIGQALAFKSNIEVYAGDYRGLEGSRVIVVTAGKPRTPEMKSRMELLEVNRRIIRDVASKIKNLKGDPVIVTLTNPVDVMNYLVWRCTGFERRRVIGSAGQLDSARLRIVLSRRFRVPVLEVEAYVIGEHGENMLPLFSRVRIKGESVTLKPEERLEVLKELRETALNVISKKGATIYAPATNTADLVEAVVEDQKKLLICSAVLNGEYGLKGLSIGVPAIIGRRGVEEIIEWTMTGEEAQTFKRGAERLKSTISSLGSP